MINTDYFKNKNVVVAGIARSGLACANLLYDLGANVSVTDSRKDERVIFNIKRLKSRDIKFEIGGHSRKFIGGNDILVLSPGISMDSEAVNFAREFNISVMSEIEVAWMVCPATVIAVTGSNGKTTVTTLIGTVIESLGKKAFICGNIGKPYSSEVARMEKEDFASLEVSSFQLETIHKFKPKISVILNVSPNHLDRYRDMDEYLQAKKRIFINQDSSDYLVLNGEDIELRKVAKESKAKVIYFYSEKGINPNQAAVITVGSILGIDKKNIMEVLSRFKGLEHRMEHVKDKDGIEFINDSKSTTADSTLWALRQINKPVILIAGGRDKGVTYSSILKEAEKKVVSLIVIGEARKKIKAELGRALPFEEARNLEEAVTSAYLKAKKGECILFSPMCSSFDMFSDYEARGNAFKKLVEGLGYKRKKAE